VIPGKQYRPEDLLSIAWRRKWLIAIPFVLIASAAAIGSSYLTNKYRAETLILVVPQRVPESYVRATVTARIEDRLQSISQQIMSRPRLEQVIQDFDLYPAQRRTAVMEDVIARMRREIEVVVVKGDSFRIAYVSEDPRTAMLVVERLGSLFIEENLRDREVLAEGTNQFLEAQLQDARQRLVDYEKKLSDYQREHSDELPSQMNFNLQAQHNAELQIQSILDSLSADRDRRLILDRQIADASVRDPEEFAAPRPGLTEVEAATLSPADQLAAAQANLATLELRLKPEHPDVLRAKRIIADLERRIPADGGVAPSRTAPVTASPARTARENRARQLRDELANLNRQIAAKEDQERRLRASIGTFQGRIAAAPGRASELSELTRDYSTLQDLYKNLLQKNEDSKIAANLERRQIGEQFKVVEPARLPERPFSPNRQRINLMAAAIGLALGVGAAALLEYADTAMRSESDVIAALALPVLAIIPYVGRNDRGSGKRLLTTATGGASVIAALAWRLGA
jgi:polysaccharide chain length determinant protein (PEP-CTERM system associated)